MKVGAIQGGLEQAGRLKMDAMERYCPLCGVLPYQPCRTPSDRSTWFGRPHQARITGWIVQADIPYHIAHKLAGHV